MLPRGAVRREWEQRRILGSGDGLLYGRIHNGKLEFDSLSTPWE